MIYPSVASVSMGNRLKSNTTGMERHAIDNMARNRANESVNDSKVLCGRSEIQRHSYSMLQYCICHCIRLPKLELFISLLWG